MRLMRKYLVQAGHFGLLWLSLLVNLYFLIFQPRSAISLRRLGLSAGIALGLVVLLWFLRERGMTATGWRAISTKGWWMGMILAVVLFIIAPAPTLHSLIAPVEVRLNFEPLDSQEATFQLVWLNNGLADLSFKDLELPPTAQITPGGVSLTAGQGQPAEVRWRGRIWQELLVTVQSRTPLRLSAQVGSQSREILLEGGANEKGIHLPYLSFGLYAAGYVLVMALGSLSLAWLAQISLNGVAWLNRRHPDTLGRLICHLPLASLVGVGLFYLLTLRSGHPWGDDFAQYIAHARNLAQGQPYTAIGILHNPAVVLGPSAYPPLLPLLLVPLYTVFGLNLTIFKLVGVACGLGSLALFNEWLKDRFPPPLRALAILLAGLHPWFWDYKDQILSDMPFVLLGMLSLLWWERWRDSKAGVKGWMVGLAIAAAITARSVGFLLLAAVLVDAVLHRRWQTRDFWFVIGIPLLVAMMLNLALPSTGDYLDQTRGWNWSILQENINSMISFFQGMWRNDMLRIGEVSLISMIGIALLILGLVFRLPYLGAVEWFVLGNLAMIAVWPYNQGFRFYLPISFFVFYYVLYGWQQGSIFFSKFNPIPSGMVQKGISFLALAIFTVGVLQGYLSDYRRIPLKEFDNGIGLPASQQMFEYVREETRPTDVIAFFKPRALALFTGRNAFAPYWNPQQPQRLLEDLKTFRADYLVVWKPDYPDLAGFARNQFPLLFKNDDFEIYSSSSLRP